MNKAQSKIKNKNELKIRFVCEGNNINENKSSKQNVFLDLHRTKKECPPINLFTSSAELFEVDFKKLL